MRETPTETETLAASTGALHLSSPAWKLQLTFFRFAATEIVRSTETATIELPAVTEVVQLAALTGQLSAAPKLLNDGADAFSSQRPHGDPDPSSGHSYCDVDRSACTSHR